MTKNRTPTPVYLDPGMHSGLEVKGLMTGYPANTRRWPSARLMLGQRRRANASCLRERWATISPTLGQRHVFAG